MKIYIKRDGYHLLPADQESLKYIKKMSKTDEYSIEIKKARNVDFHRKLFALFNTGFKNVETDLPFDVWRKVKIMAAGYFKAYNTGKGMYYEAKSISFSSMSQDEFDEMYKKILQIIANEIGLTNEQLEMEVLTRF